MGGGGGGGGELHRRPSGCLGERQVVVDGVVAVSK